jgi:putative transposase
VKQALPGNSLRRICRVLHVARSSLGTPSEKAGRKTRDPSELEGMLQLLIREHPTYGYRRLWALLRFRLGIRANRKRIYRILKDKRWLVHQRPVTPRPRVKASVSRTTKSDRRWAMDMTHVVCGRDGWAHLVGVIDCCDRELLGWELAMRGRAKEAERAIEEACIARFGTLRLQVKPRWCEATTS